MSKNRKELRRSLLGLYIALEEENLMYAKANLINTLHALDMTSFDLLKELAKETDLKEIGQKIIQEFGD